MKIKLRKKEKNYAQVHRNMLENKNISLKAKGLGSILELYSDNFDLTQTTLIDKSIGEKRAFKSALKELETFDYLYRFQTHSSNDGQFLTVWLFDSEHLDINYIHENLIPFRYITPLTTVGTFCTAGTKSGHAQCTPYNNTTSEYTNMDALEGLLEIQKQEKKSKQKKRNYEITPRANS